MSELAERQAIALRVMRAMRHASARVPLKCQDSEGTFRLVVCLRDDTVQYAAERVAEAGRSATVVVPHRDGLVPLSWRQASDEDEGLFQSDGPIHPDSTMGALVDYLDMSGVNDFTFHVSSELGAVEVTEGPEIRVPA